MSVTVAATYCAFAMWELQSYGKASATCVLGYLFCEGFGTRRTFLHRQLSTRLTDTKTMERADPTKDQDSPPAKYLVAN
jgi:hypothetical protein